MEEPEKKEFVPTPKDIARRRVFFLGVFLVLTMMVLVLLEVFDIFTNTIGC